MKFSKIISMVVVVIIMLNTLGISAFATIDTTMVIDNNTGVIQSPAGDDMNYTKFDKTREAIPALVTEPVEKEVITGKIANGNLVHEEAFKVDSYLMGTNARMETTFHAGEWKVNEIQLSLVYSASQFLDDTKSSFTVLINGVRCVTEKQPTTYGERSQIKLTLPASELKLGINTLSIEADILTVGMSPDTVGTIESGWFNVFKDSTIAILYEPLNNVLDIKEFYKKFTSIESLDFKKSVVATPSNPSNSELQNAMYAISGTSKNTDFSFQNIGFKASDSKANLSDFDNIIYVSNYGNLNDEFKSGLTDWHKNQAEESAVIALVKEDKQNILIVTGTNEKALENAAKLLANKGMMQQMMYTGREVYEDETYELAPKPFEQYRVLTDIGTHLVGESIQSVNYYIEFPYNRMITDKSQLYLVFRYSDNLDFQRSLMTVYINETPIASKKLNENSSARDEVTFHIPTDIAVAGNFVLRVSFDLRVNGSDGGSAPWAFISNESTLKINSASQPFLVFENYPSPFVKDGTFSNLMVVLPENPTDADLSVLSGTFSLFGQYIESSEGQITIVHDNEIFDIKNKNIITIGIQSLNKYTQSLNSSMFFKFSEDGKQILSNEKMLIDATHSTEMGTIQLLESPSAKDHAILIMTGTSEKGLLKAASYIKTPDYAWKVFGDGFVVDMEKIYNFKFKADNVKTLSIPSKIRLRADLTSLIIVLSMLSLMMILSFIFLLTKYKKGVKSDEK